MTERPITEDDLQAHVDGALDAARQAEVAAYLVAHPDVARRVDGYRAQREALREALAPVAREPIPSELNLARLIADRRRPRAIAGWRAVAAAVALLGIGSAGGWAIHDAVRPVPEGIAALAHEAADSYAVYAPDTVRPVEIRAVDRGALIEWASARLGRNVAVPDLSASGYRFMGGRLVATGHGPAVLFMYDDDRGTRLVLLSRTMAVDRDAPMTDRADGPVAGVTWAAKGLGYSLVGPLPTDRLRPLADAVRRQVGGAA